MKRTTLIPYLRIPCTVEGGTARFGNGAREPLQPVDAQMIDTVFQGGSTLEDLHRIATDAGVETTMEQMEASFRAHDSVIGVAEVDLCEDAEILMVEQGYGGVYVHSVELFKKLRERWKCALLSPVRPLFENEPLEGIHSLDQLEEVDPSLDYLAWVQIVRTIVKRSKCRLLMLMHRSQSLFLFDLLDAHQTVIYCDGFFDGAFRRVHDFHLDRDPERSEQVLAEVYFVLANGQRDFLGIAASPSCNVRILMAGAYSLDAAVENWCWGVHQQVHFQKAFPSLASSIKLALPFTNGDIFSPDLAVERERRVLFTTTMHNIDQKGYPELVEAMQIQRDIKARVVVRQPERLPKAPAAVLKRMEMGGVPKPEMTRLYHTLWVNCRTSRSESSPMSILESMTCELPQIVSPTVAEQIPIIEDGVTGFVVDPDDPEELARCLATILGNRRLRDRMGRECRRRALVLSFENRVGEFERLLS